MWNLSLADEAAWCPYSPGVHKNVGMFPTCQCSVLLYIYIYIYIYMTIQTQRKNTQREITILEAAQSAGRLPYLSARPRARQCILCILGNWFCMIFAIQNVKNNPLVFILLLFVLILIETEALLFSHIFYALEIHFLFDFSFL